MAVAAAVARPAAERWPSLLFGEKAGAEKAATAENEAAEKVATAAKAAAANAVTVKDLQWRLGTARAEGTGEDFSRCTKISRDPSLVGRQRAHV